MSWRTTAFGLTDLVAGQLEEDEENDQQYKQADGDPFDTFGCAPSSTGAVWDVMKCGSVCRFCFGCGPVLRSCSGRGPVFRSCSGRGRRSAPPFGGRALEEGPPGYRKRVRVLLIVWLLIQLAPQAPKAATAPR